MPYGGRFGYTQSPANWMVDEEYCSDLESDDEAEEELRFDVSLLLKMMQKNRDVIMAITSVF